MKTNFSELTCNDCSFWVFASKDEDSFIHVRGNAAVKNLKNIEKMDLVQDSTIFSFNSLQNKITSIEEKANLNSLLINFDEISREESKQIENNNNLKIKLKNIKNIERIIYLNYTKKNSEE